MKFSSAISLSLLLVSQSAWAAPESYARDQEDFLLSADKIADILALSAPLPTNSAIIALSRPFAVPEGEGRRMWDLSCDELAQELAIASLPESRKQELQAVYHSFVTNVTAFAERMEEYRYRKQWAVYGLYDTPERPQMAPFPLPEDLPAEFRLFALAVQQHYAGEEERARETLEELLALPPNRRIYRTCWAKAFLAQTYGENDPGRTIRELKALRAELLLQGNRDVRLATYVLRCEAGAYGSVTNHPQSLNCYFALNLLGRREGDAMARVANLIMQCDDATLDVALRNEAIARYVTWHAATMYSNLRLKTLDEVDKKAILRWTDLLLKGAPGAELCQGAALAAYRCGSLELAERAGRMAPPTDPLTAWVLAKAKLARQDVMGGQSDLATIYYGLPNLPPAIRKEVGHELALLYTSGQRYRDAMKILLENGFWSEAAYVAEQVLTTDELKAFLKERELSGAGKGNPELEGRLRYLLARRLVRDGLRLHEALPYFPLLRQSLASRLESSMALGADSGRSAKERGLARCDAARTFHYAAAPLCAAENEPDWFCSGGENCRPMSLRRRQMSRLAPIGADEAERVAANAPALAAQDFCLENAVSQTWLAVELLPDNSEELAEILREAGGWTENCAAETARRLYEALVNRCPATDLGRRAAELHWFPRD